MTLFIFIKHDEISRLCISFFECKIASVKKKTKTCLYHVCKCIIIIFMLDI